MNEQAIRIEAFLNRPTGRDECKPDTWGVWLKSALAGLYVLGRKLDGDKPLGRAGWQGDLDRALPAHGLTFEQVLGYVFEGAAS